MLTVESAGGAPPSGLIDAVAARSVRHESPCGEGALAWRCWGAGPPVVLLHGGTGSWMHWIHNVLPLSADRAVWAPDMPGYGDSAAPPRNLPIGALAEIVADGMARLIEDAVDLVGFSFGALVAGHLAAAHPQKVRRLVLVGAGGLGLREGKRLPLVAWRHLKEPLQQAAAHRHNLASLMFADPGRIDPLALHVQSENARRSRLNSGPFSRGNTLLEPLSRLRIPLAGIWGRHDATVEGRLAEVEPILQRADPQSRLHIVEDSGHWVAYEQAMQFNATLLRVLRDA